MIAVAGDAASGDAVVGGSEAGRSGTPSAGKSGNGGNSGMVADMVGHSACARPTGVGSIGTPSPGATGTASPAVACKSAFATTPLIHSGSSALESFSEGDGAGLWGEVTVAHGTQQQRSTAVPPRGHPDR